MIDLCSVFGVAKIIHLRTKEGITFDEVLKDAKNTCTGAYEDLKTESGKKLAEKYFKLTKKIFEKLNI